LLKFHASYKTTSLIGHSVLALLPGIQVQQTHCILQTRRQSADSHMCGI